MYLKLKVYMSLNSCKQAIMVKTQLKLSSIKEEKEKIADKKWNPSLVLAHYDHNVGYGQVAMLVTTSNDGYRQVVILATTTNDGYRKTITPYSFMYDGSLYGQQCLLQSDRVDSGSLYQRPPIRATFAYSSLVLLPNCIVLSYFM